MKSAVVTGCGEGIGRAIFERLAADGWSMCGLERESALAEECERSASGATVIVGDASDAAALDSVAAAAAGTAPLGAWVNNASTLAGGGILHELTAEAAERIFAVNLGGYVWGCATAARMFVKQRSPGAIVNISSVHGRVGFSGHSAYDTSKGGIDALTRYVAVEYGPAGIRANAVAPGGVLTPGAIASLNRTADPDRALREAARQAPLRRLASPAEIAEVTAFLVSDRASFLTGQSIAVDGGLTAACMSFTVDPSLKEAYGDVLE